MQGNIYEEQRKRGIKRKLEAIIKLGGGCSKCGYDGNLSALEFHHITLDEKSFTLDLRNFANYSIEKLNKEVDKCKVLCTNCHREEHNPTLSKDLYDEFLKYEKSTLDKVFGDICPVCNSNFKKSKGKIYCSKKCRESDKKYPTKEEVEVLYISLKSWEKVANHFNLTRKIIQGIRKIK